MNKIQEKVGKDTLSVYHEKIGSRKRLLAKCLNCNKFEEDAKKHSRNGIVYLAHGMRFYPTEKLVKIADHFEGNAHQAAVDAKTIMELWKK